MPSGRIGTSHEHLDLEPDDSAGRPDRLRATLLLGGLSASVLVVHHYASGFQDLAEFFKGLEQNWRGWPDVRSWESLEHDLRIDARHEYGHVRLSVTMTRWRADWGNDGWRAVGDLSIEPGEQLSQIARDVADLASGWGYPEP